MTDCRLTRAAYTRPRWWAAIVVGCLAAAGASRAVEVADVRREFVAGNYKAALEESEAGFREAPGNLDWEMLRIEVLLTTGRKAMLGLPEGVDPPALALTPGGSGQW